MVENKNGLENEIEKEDDGELMVGETVREYDADRLYTVEEFLAIDWGEGRRMELHDGIVIVLEQPVVKHQRIHSIIFGRLFIFLDGKPCEVFGASPGVRPKKTEETLSSTGYSSYM